MRMLVAAIASCNHAPEAQTSLVTEVKNALSRALALPECTNKHTKIQALTGTSKESFFIKGISRRFDKRKITKCNNLDLKRKVWFDIVGFIILNYY